MYGSTWTRRSAGLVVAALAASAAGALPAAAATTNHAPPAAALSAAALPDSAGSYIVQAASGRLGAVRAAVTRLGGSVSRELGVINAVSATLPAGAPAALRAMPGVRAVTPNASARLLEDADYRPAGDMRSMYAINRITGAASLWSAGFTGAGVDVALLDSGISPVAGLNGHEQVLNGPDLTPESQNPATANLDTFGHGTHMAGIIAGRDVTDSLTDSSKFIGVAPGARLVSVKAADAHGNTDVSQIIAGIGWVVQHAKDPGMNIRVLNLSYGTDSLQSYLLDPLAYAAEQAWKAGIVVVVSTGNSGSVTGRVDNPAINPYVIAVGADDTKDTASISDDVIPSFSSRGDGKRNPDLVAPGVSVQSLRVPGSYVDDNYFATGGINERFMRGSGTSQAAAVVSGAVALTLSARPDLKPDQVKAMLKATASDLSEADQQAQGSGLINLRKVRFATASTVPQSFAASTGLGTLEGARGGGHLVLDGVTLHGEVDIMGAPFVSATMARLQAARASWSGGTWNGRTWAGSAWAGRTWAGAAWTGNDWSGRTWAGRTWANGSWDGRTWANTSWSGSTWAGSQWDGRTWAGRTWAAASWTDTVWQ